MKFLPHFEQFLFQLILSLCERTLILENHLLQVLLVVLELPNQKQVLLLLLLVFSNRALIIFYLSLLIMDRSKLLSRLIL
jgi:hypothetical protein